MNLILNDYSQQIHVLDSTVFIGMDFPILQTINVKKFLTTHSVIEELKDFRSKMNLDVMRQTNKLEVISPSPREINLFSEKIHNLDPNIRLSETDIQVLTLTWNIKGVVVTNDLAMQNIAQQMNIPIRVISGKLVKDVRRSYLQCKSCKKTFRVSSQQCPDCGGVLKQYFTKGKSKGIIRKK